MWQATCFVLVMTAVDSLTWSIPTIGPQSLPDAQGAAPAARHGFSFHDILNSLNPFHHSDAAAGAPQATAEHHGFSFHDILNIGNPLQHLPVIGTLYRAITGDQINTFDKIAGDTLYGGAVGFASSMADTVFKAVTGRYFGDEVLALVLGDHGSSDTAVAQATAPASAAALPAPSALASSLPAPSVVTSNTPVPFVQPEPAIAAVQQPDLSALQQSLLKNGIDPLLAQRATFAYQRATNLSQRTVSGPDAALATP
jgi:hypothetical protein